MRQAIEEGFIHDVLANYVTYETYFKIDKAITDDPELDKSRASAAIARLVSLHEHNLAQRAEIIVNHFRSHVASKIGGHAKAMVVTASRLHALRYKRALDKYCAEHGIGDVGVLAAFSGKLDDAGEEWTESRVNGYPESETPRRFDTDDWQILVVAEKYQTGFDQPKLYAMYVDKTLTGLAAVQTLSRVNRTHPDKTGTFVLDSVTATSRSRTRSLRGTCAPTPRRPTRTCCTTPTRSSAPSTYSAATRSRRWSGFCWRTPVGTDRIDDEHERQLVIARRWA
jgi:type I restriction enzyme, R subunit